MPQYDDCDVRLKLLRAHQMQTTEVTICCFVGKTCQFKSSHVQNSSFPFFRQERKTIISNHMQVHSKKKKNQILLGFFLFFVLSISPSLILSFKKSFFYTKYDFLTLRILFWLSTFAGILGSLPALNHQPT